MKTGFSSQRREMLLLLNLNHQHDITCKTAISFFVVVVFYQPLNTSLAMNFFLGVCAFPLTLQH